MKYIPRELSKEIREKLKLVVKPRSHGMFKELFRADCNSFCQKRRGKAIGKNAQIHSYRIESPMTMVPFSVPRNKGKRGIREGIQNIGRAVQWGKENFDPANFEEDFFREISGRIEPEIYAGDLAQYRTTGTRITGASVTPPEPYKVNVKEIPWLVESLKRQLECPHLINKIEGAFFAHLHIARIHPFVDGNGRTARAVQDVILDHYNLPVPIIEVGERHDYYKRLDEAVYGWKHERCKGETEHGATRGERSFYTFMAGKLNISLDNLLGFLGNKI